MIRSICLLCLCALPLLACNSSTSTPSDPNGGVFTVPSSSYFKIDGVSSNPSADAPRANQGRADFRVTKSFTFTAGTSTNAEMHLLTPYNSTIGSDLTNGASKIYYLSRENKSDSKDSVQLYLTMDKYPTGVYEMSASSGAVYISKLRDTLRCTTVGAITVSGTNSLPPYDAMTRTMECNISADLSF